MFLKTYYCDLNINLPTEIINIIDNNNEEENKNITINEILTNVYTEFIIPIALILMNFIRMILI